MEEKEQRERKGRKESERRKGEKEETTEGGGERSAGQGRERGRPVDAGTTGTRRKGA